MFGIYKIKSLIIFHSFSTYFVQQYGPITEKRDLLSEESRLIVEEERKLILLLFLNRQQI